MLKLKPYIQTTGYCGPASLKMVLEFYGLKKSEKELAKLSGATVAHGVEASGLLKAVKKLGFKGFIKNYATFTDIKKYLKQNTPVIVGWFSVNDGHYSVIVGIDKKFIYLQDPEYNKVRKLKLKTFYRVWFDFMGDFLKSPRDIIIRQILVILPY